MDTSGYGSPIIDVVYRDTDNELRLAFVDPKTGQVIPRDKIRLRPGPGADAHVHAILNTSKGKTEK